MLPHKPITQEATANGYNYYFKKLDASLRMSTDNKYEIT